MTPLDHRYQSQQASVLIVVMVVCLGLVSLTLVFGHSMLMAYRGADNRMAAHQAEQAIEGAARYAEYLITNVDQPGEMPDPTSYQSEAVPIDDATFWFIGTPGPADPTDTPTFCLVDEASKLNLNTVTSAMLMQLPGMTQDLATSIIQWRTSSSGSTTTPSSSTASSSSTANSPIKYAPFESMEELALLSGTDMSVLYGNDDNLNHILDPNEADDSQGLPSSGSNTASGQLESGLMEYVTVFSREPNVLTDGTTPRFNIARLSDANKNALITVLSSALGDSKRAEQLANQLIPRVSQGGRPLHVEKTLNSVLEFYVVCGDMTADEFDKIAPYLTATTGHFVNGLVNVNTASESVLACIPGLSEKAADLVSARTSRTQPSTGFAWVKSVLGNQAAIQAGPYLTWRTYQITADVAAVGRYGRGYRRTQFVIDSSLGAPRIVYRRNLAYLGWALGSDARDSLGIKNNTQ